jgi:hypothetical protein
VHLDKKQISESMYSVHLHLAATSFFTSALGPTEREAVKKARFYKPEARRQNIVCEHLWIEQASLNPLPGKAEK